MKSLLYISILLITACNLSAQQVIKGTVTDAGNGQPVDAATVQIRKTGRQLPLTYTLTKADGTFILPLHQADDSLFVHVSLLGYKSDPAKDHSRDKTSHPPRTGNLHSERGRDTSGARLRATRHDQLRRVAIHQSERRSDQRRTEKLPGVDVDDDGKISYNGKTSASSMWKAWT